MTVSVVSSDKEPPPPKQINFAEPLVDSVRVYLAGDLPTKRPALLPPPDRAAAPHASALAPHTCDVDIGAPSSLQDCKGINFEPRLKRNDLNNNANRATSGRREGEAEVAGERAAMPSQAELMQRQPLLARVKPDAHAAQATTDESDPDPEQPSPQRGDFVVEIPAAGARDERYPKEIWKTFLSFFFLFGCVCVNMLSLSLVHERLPDVPTAPLRDAVLDEVTARDWGLKVSEILIMLSTTTAMLVVIFHKHRFIVARRLFFIIGLLYLYRSITMYVTVLPVSNTNYFCSPKANSTAPLIVVKRMFYLISGFGLSINGKHTYCGDYIYSGHTMILVLSYLVVAEYSPKKLWPVQWALWATALLGVGFLLLAHGHYTVDVVIAYYITTRLFWCFHSLLAAPHRNYMIQREWWFTIFLYLERNVRGPVPRRYDWPLPWPRTKLFSRLS